MIEKKKKKKKNFEWHFWFTWWFLLSFWHSRLFEFIIQKHETLTENPPIQIYSNKIKKRIVFKIKTGYKLELLILETMRLLGSTKKDVNSYKNSENVPKLGSVKLF